MSPKKTKTKKPKNVFTKQDVLLHNREQQFFIVESVEFMGHKQDWLYTLKLVAKEGAQYKRCYQNEISDKYSQVKNADTIKLIYGKL